jgi:hypothetical protein
MTPPDDTVVVPSEIQDLRLRVGRLETCHDEHGARLAALEARFGAIEARLQRQHVVLAGLQADQSDGFRAVREQLADQRTSFLAIRGMLGQVLTFLGAAEGAAK